MSKLLTSKGNLKFKSESNAIVIDKRTKWIIEYWQKKGLPYYPTNKKYRQDKFEVFMKTNDKFSLDFNNRAFKFNGSGLSLAWSYHPHAFKVQCNNNKSPYDIFKDKERFSLAIRKALKGSFFQKTSYEDLMSSSDKIKERIRGYLRRVSGSQMVSNFRPVTASSLYRLFCDEGDTVWDMSCGWGGRLLIGQAPRKSAIRRLFLKLTQWQQQMLHGFLGMSVICQKPATHSPAKSTCLLDFFANVLEPTMSYDLCTGERTGPDLHNKIQIRSTSCFTSQ